MRTESLENLGYTKLKYNQIKETTSKKGQVILLKQIFKNKLIRRSNKLKHTVHQLVKHWNHFRKLI